MFRSGRWTGFWEQDEYGQQPMSPLTLQFEAGRITGHGEDIVGAFEFNGTYNDQGRVEMMKHYIGEHSVLYIGKWDGEGSIRGEWSIPPYDEGKFALFFSGGEEVADLPIVTVVPNVQSPTDSDR